MADGGASITNKGKALTEEQRLSLSIHSNTMDTETAGTLHKINGISQLLMGAVEGENAGLPDGLIEGLWVINDLATAALKRAGAL